MFSRGSFFCIHQYCPFEIKVTGTRTILCIDMEKAIRMAGRVTRLQHYLHFNYNNNAATRHESFTPSVHVKINVSSYVWFLIQHPLALTMGSISVEMHNCNTLWNLEPVLRWTCCWVSPLSTGWWKSAKCVFLHWASNISFSLKRERKKPPWKVQLGVFRSQKYSTGILIIYKNQCKSIFHMWDK